MVAAPGGLHAASSLIPSNDRRSQKLPFNEVLTRIEQWEITTLDLLIYTVQV
jgi:hypothetical protein